MNCTKLLVSVMDHFCPFKPYMPDLLQVLRCCLPRFYPTESALLMCSPQWFPQMVEVTSLVPPRYFVAVVHYRFNSYVLPVSGISLTGVIPDVLSQPR